MTIAVAVIAAAAVVVGLIVLGMAVRSIKLAVRPALRSGSVVSDPVGVANGVPTPDPTRASPPGADF